MFPTLARDLAAIVGEKHVRQARAERMTYSMDGLPTHRRVPDLVVLPGSREEVIAVVRLLAALGVPFVPRGAGTGLSGGALADEGSVLLVLTRLNRILEIDKNNRRAVVEPGVVNAKLGAAAKPHGLQYAPDPSSQSACTIGGNVAENAGGPHCLKYGVTVNHILALEVLLADGSLVELGSPGGEPGGGGPDLVGVFVGSEGNFGVATKITVRLTPLPRAICACCNQRGRARAAVAGPQAGLRRDGPVGARSRGPGCRRPPLRPPPCPRHDLYDREELWTRGQQRLSRRRRQPPPQHLVRCDEPDTQTQRGGGERGDHGHVHRRRGDDHWRTWGGNRQAQVYAADLRCRVVGCDARGAPGV